ncbi:MAG TPA: ABC transporter ATP-binding protein [Acidobacteriaceae bacterium]|nr:ABC transporter ATP-binding protein [Acidobacteriaceae bacterium]
MSDTLLRVQLSAGYSGKPTLSGIQFQLQQGEILGLVGSSGAGKSTLVLSLLGLLPWRGGRVSGQVLLRGQNLLTLPEKQLRRLRGREIALIPQSPMTALNAAVSLRRHFEEAWKAHQPRKREILAQRIRELMAEVQLPSDAEFLLRRPRQISVGQAQRILIALALLHRPALIVADEPTSALDPVTQSQIVDLLRNLNRRYGMTLLYISHDLTSVIRLCDHVAVLHDGSLVENLPVGQLSEARHPASLSLLRALPVPPETLLRFRDSAVADELLQTPDYLRR